MLNPFYILIIIAALTACEKQPQNNVAPLQKVIVAFTYQPQSTLVHVALAKGYFAEEGLDVQPLMRTYGKAALQEVLDKKADFATVAETPVMFSVLKGDKIFLIANIEASSTNNAIVARKDAGIRKIGDLKGKRIAFTPGTTSEYFLYTLLTANGLNKKEIKTIPMKPEEMMDAMVAKKIDAASTWNYPLTQIEHQLGSNGKIFFDKEIYTETFNIVSQQDFVQKNPEAVKHFLRALIKAEEFVSKNPDEAQSIMSIATKIDKNLIHEVWENFGYKVELDHTILLTLEDETRWAMENKLIEPNAMPDYLNYIYTDSLSVVKPEVVKMNR